MDKNTPVSTIMTKKVIVATLNNRFTQVRKLFLDYNLHHLPVTDGNDKVIGIIAYHDVLQAYVDFGKTNKVFDDKVLDSELKIGNIMTKNPDTIAPAETIYNVAGIFTKKKYHSLPVVENGKIKGLVTSNDLIKFVLKS